MLRGSVTITTTVNKWEIKRVDTSHLIKVLVLKQMRMS